MEFTLLSTDHYIYVLMMCSVFTSLQGALY